MNAWRNNLAGLLVAVLVVLRCTEALAIFTTDLRYSSEEFGKREVLAFKLPPGEQEPTLSLLDPLTLRVTVPNLLALPLPDLDVTQTKYIQGFKVTEIPGGQMGLYLTITLKEPYLNFRSRLAESEYTLEIERHQVPVAVGPTRLLEGLTLAGRDATLLVVAFTGHGWVEREIDHGLHMVRLRWQGASLDQGWRPVVAQGLVDGVIAYNFPRNLVEMEVRFDKRVDGVFVTRDPNAGALVLELRTPSMIGRKAEVETILANLRAGAKQGNPQPLNRLTPVFINGPTPVILNRTPIDEAHFYDSAKKAEQDYDFPKARAYLANLLKVFPETANRELVELYRVELAAKMNWKPGVVIGELEGALAHHPNNYSYPALRLLQLQLYNRAEQYDNAAAIMWDPNLPKNSPAVHLERGRTAIGLKRWEQAAEELNRVLELDKAKADHSAEAEFLLARMHALRGDYPGAVAAFEQISRVSLAMVGKHPEWVMEMGDTYLQSGEYRAALDSYIQILNGYPDNQEIAPWAMLRAGDCYRKLDDDPAALRLYDELIRNHPESEAATWAKIFILQLQRQRPLKERLLDLDRLIAEAPVTEVVVEAYFTKSILLGDAGRHQDALLSLNGLLTLTSRERPVKRAMELKHKYMVAGMQQSLEQGRPEYAVALAEQFGSDWREYPGFDDAKLLLGEALLRIGITPDSLELLRTVQRQPAPELVKLGELIQSGPQGAAKSRAMESSPPNSAQAARARLDQARTMVKSKEWEGIILLLEEVSDSMLNESERLDRIRLLAKAEEGRGRFPQAVGNLERLLYDRPVGDGLDYYWYAILMQLWKGDEKSMAAFQIVVDEAQNNEIKGLAMMRVGDILQRAGKLAEAQEYFSQADALLPDTTMAKVSKEIALQLEMVK